MSHALATMRVDDKVTKIKTISDAKNSLLEKRRKKKEAVKQIYFYQYAYAEEWDSIIVLLLELFLNYT